MGSFVSLRGRTTPPHPRPIFATKVYRVYHSIEEHEMVWSISNIVIAITVLITLSTSSAEIITSAPLLLVLLFLGAAAVPLNNSL